MLSLSIKCEETSYPPAHMIAEISSNSLLESSAASCDKSDISSEVAVSAPANTLFAHAISGWVVGFATEEASAGDASACTEFGHASLLFFKSAFFRYFDAFHLLSELISTPLPRLRLSGRDCHECERCHVLDLHTMTFKDRSVGLS